MPKSFPVSCNEHNAILEQCDTLKGHFEVLRFALQGIVRETGGDTGHLKALESVASNANNSLLEMETMIEKLRKEDL